MPVLLERRLRDPDGRDGIPGRRLVSRFPSRDPKVIEIGLVNNMPDAALGSTEAQFQSLLAAAAQDFHVRLRLWSVPGVRRSDAGLGHVAARHLPFHRIWGSALDGLVVTGSEPRERDLRREPFWDDLAQLFDWVALSGVSSIYSCLAAHAAMLHLEGIERTPLADKRSGVFAFESTDEHPVGAHAPAMFQAPHSRWNDVSEAALRACGYSIVSRSDEAGVNICAREGDGLNLYFQGHPEYDAQTLLLEYRRDIGRYLRGERDTYPAAPEHYFDARAQRVADDFRRAADAERSPALIASFPTAQLSAGLANTWRAPAVVILRNWLQFISARKARAALSSVAASARHPAFTPSRPSRAAARR